MDEKRRQAARNRRLMQLDESSDSEGGDGDLRGGFQDDEAIFAASHSAAFPSANLDGIPGASNAGALLLPDFNKVKRNAEQML